MNCRHCGTPLTDTVLDLGCAPPSNSYLNKADLNSPETHYPLRLFACSRCFLVQTEDFTRADMLFHPDYAYFSSVSSTWCAHAARYAAMIRRKLRLGPGSFVLEVASNDGYLLRNFVEMGIPCLGIEPTDRTAEAAERLGIPVIREFFGLGLSNRLTDEGRQADLLVGNNVFAHVPDINDFTAGIREALKPDGVVTLEFPHLLKLLRLGQFDTVYHEHYSYLSLRTVCAIFESEGLRAWHVEQLPTHGGSLRVYGCRRDSSRARNASVSRVLETERRFGLDRMETYGGLQAKADRIKDDLLAALIRLKRRGLRLAAYGAAAKGNTLLNYAGIRADLVPYVCDAAPSKQNRFLPGSRLPILPVETLREDKPDVILVLPWNIVSEIVEHHGYVRQWGGRFLTAVPSLKFR
ncbi:class I SAM-dependent methyltransferase [Fundidesulfovibrio soli]|uniref:class I SAM-dependent methyltransferase n=1 Tax=Fundidesulfovibrio soli TaxID=2922716 RepID=UPI001FAED45C|nr:class I SAM-dependent methyltransferase [Fundidesulfovibrio soli]